MASSIHSNPVYYSLASLSSRQYPSTRTVVLHKRPDHSGFGVYVGEDVPSGLYIVTVERNSPASDANIQPGDRVLAINGQSVSSMSTNPKDALIRAATNAQSLSLTIQSTDIFQKLDIPPVNNTDYNPTQHKRKYHSSARQLNHNADLESYIRSLFGDEDIQILPAPNQNEFILKSDSYPKSATNFHSFPIHSNHSNDQKRHHRRHRHHNHHRRPKQTHLQTREAQTSTNDDLDENVPQSQQQQPHSAYPSMGKSQLITRTQQPATNKTVYNPQHLGYSADDNELDFMPIPRSPVMDHAPPSRSNQTAFSTQPISAPSSTPTTVNRNPTNDMNISHMADAVTAAMAAQKRDQLDNREQVVPRGQIVTSRAAATPPSSREQAPSIQQASIPSTSTRPNENSRELASAPKRSSPPPPAQTRNATPPQTRSATSSQIQNATSPQSRSATSSQSRSATSSQIQSATPPQTQNAPPPPYTPKDNNYESSRPADDRSSVNRGAPDARNSQPNQTFTLSAGLNSTREIQLHRIPDFQGFGFHLQYNKMYYLVQRIEAGGPAENAGLEANDVILSINQQDTRNMAHVTFVEIVNSNQDVTFLVQHLDDFLRANPQRARTQQPTTSTVATRPSNESEKPKSGLSKALGKLTNR